MNEATILNWERNMERTFPYLNPGMFQRVSQRYLGGTPCLRIIALANAWQGKETVKALADSSFLCNEAKVPIPVKLIAVFWEDPRVNPDRVNAGRRLYRHFTEKPLPVNEQGPMSQNPFHGSKALDELVESVPKTCERRNIPHYCGDPTSPEGLAWLRKIQGLGEHDRPFEMAVVSVWGKWVNWNLRRFTGELSMPIPGHPNGKRTLVEPGFCFGIHPNLETGGKEGLSHLAGCQPFDYALDKRFKKGRMAFMSIAGSTMDDSNLWLADGPVREYKIDYRSHLASEPDREQRTRNMFRELQGNISKWVRPSLKDCLGLIIAERCMALERRLNDHPGNRTQENVV